MCHQLNTGTHCDEQNNPFPGIHKQAHQPSTLVHVIINTALWVKTMISKHLNREDGSWCLFAWNKVDHRKLILKLYEIGICNQITMWDEDFPTSHTKFIVLERQLSSLHLAAIGVSQRSVICPMSPRLHMISHPLILPKSLISKTPQPSKIDKRRLTKST